MGAALGELLGVGQAGDAIRVEVYVEAAGLGHGEVVL